MNMRQTILLLGMLMMFGSINAQTSYPFIKYDTSRIIYPGDSASMLKFFAKLDALKKGDTSRLTIAHYGGSHIQAGYWTEALADSFQALGGYVGGGAYLFPYRLIKTNGPPFYRSHGTGEWKRCRAVPSEMCSGLGMSGISATTSDSIASFGFQLRPNDHINSFTYIRVYHNFNPDYVIEVPKDFPATYLRHDYPELGYVQFHFQTPVDSVHFDIHRNSSTRSDFILRGWSIENENPGVYYASMGVNGASTRSYLQCTEFVKELGTLHPDLVIFSIGVNDAQDADLVLPDFFARYDSICAIVRAINPDCAILFTTITDNYIKRKTKNTRSLKVNAQIMAVAQKYNAGVWDMFTVMGGLGSIDKWYRNGLAAPDRIHFNAKGYGIAAGLMFSAIKDSYMYNTTLSK